MKKIGLLCAAVLLCGGLAGCGNQHHQSNSNSSSKISKLKAENSSLKAKNHRKSSSHKHSKSSSSSDNSQAANSSNTNQTAGQKNATQTSGAGNNANQAAKQSNGDGRTGDWDNHPDIWASVNDESQWKGSMYENMSPQDRYNYQVDNANRWAAIENTGQ